MPTQTLSSRYIVLRKLANLLTSLFISDFSVEDRDDRVVIQVPRNLTEEEIITVYDDKFQLSLLNHPSNLPSPETSFAGSIAAGVVGVANIHSRANPAETSGREISSISVRSRTAAKENSSRSVKTDDRDSAALPSHDKSSSSWTGNENSADSIKQSEPDISANGSIITSLGLTQIPIEAGEIDLEGARTITTTTYSSVYSLEISYSPEHRSSAARKLPRNQQTFDTAIKRRRIVVVKKPSFHSNTRYLFSAEKRTFEELRKISTGKNNLLEPIFVPTDSWLNDKFFFLLPLAKCDLYQLFQSEVGANLAKSLKAQLPLLAEGLATLHSINIAHRDLDPRNVLVFDDGADGVSLKIADFGHSTLLNTATRTFLQLDPMIGFRSNGIYSAPECGQNEPLYSPHGLMAIDIWALGCMYLELIAFIRRGPTGVKQFQELREGPSFVAGVKVRSQMFHDGETLKPQIRAWLQKDLRFGILYSSSTQKRFMIYRSLLEMFNTEPQKRPLAGDVADLFKDVESTMILTDTTRARTEKFSASELTGKVFSWAAARISKEPPVAPGNKRVHWKCACGRILHDDFTEIEPGAVDEVQKSLNKLYGPISAAGKSASIELTSIAAGQETNVSGAGGFIENLSGAVSTADLGLKNLAPDSRHTGEPSELSQFPPGDTLTRDFADQGTFAAHGQTLWLIACFDSPLYGTVARHEDVSKETYDFEIFTKFREIYFSHRSWFARFFDLKEVKFIRFVRFDYLSLGKASILNKDDINSWPPQEDRGQWVYVPYPPKALPLVGQEHLLHIWRNPHHADQVTYGDWQKNANLWQRYNEWVRHLPTKKDLKPDLEFQEQPRRSAYIFVKIPKKKGDQLVPNYGNQAPQGWGILLEEGFKVHRFLVVILFFYFVTSIAAIIWISRKYGIGFPTTLAGLLGVLAWFITFFSLLLTVWFKWAESS